MFGPKDEKMARKKARNNKQILLTDNKKAVFIMNIMITENILRSLLGMSIFMHMTFI